MMQIILDYLHSHEVSIVKDIIVPLFALDKIATFVGVWYAIRTFSSNNKIAKLNFIYQLTISHRDIWSKISEKGYAHIIRNSTDPSEITDEVRTYIVNLILHVRISYESNKYRVQKISRETLKDIGGLFCYPAVSRVWDSLYPYHDEDFIFFVQYSKHIFSPSEYQKPRNIYYRTSHSIPSYTMYKLCKVFDRFVMNR